MTYFYSCLTLAVDPISPDSEQVYDSTLLALQPSIKPIMVGGFAGALHYKAMPWYFRLILGLRRPYKYQEGQGTLLDYVEEVYGPV